MIVVANTKPDGPLNWSRSQAKDGSGFEVGDFLGYFFDRSKTVTEPNAMP